MENSIIRAKYIKKKDTELLYSLSEHTNDVLKAFGLLQDKLKEDSKNLIPLIKLGILLHDLGKCHPYFQLHTIKNAGYKPFDLSSNIYHSLFSVLWINQSKLIEEIKKCFRNDTDSKDYLQILLSAVAYHHWKSSVENQISSSTEFERFLRKTQEKGYLKNLENNLMFEIKKFDENYDSLIKFNDEMLDGLSRDVSFFEYVVPPYQLSWLPKRQNFNLDDKKSKDWILISGFLMRSDHFASFCEENEEAIVNAEIENIGMKDIKSNIVKEIQSKTKVSEHKIWQLNEVKELEDKNVVLIAPTGSGKTEFAFLWAGDKKFFYTLPLRSAVNQIYERAKNVFGDSKTGLLHSDADIYLLDDKSESDNIKAWYQAKQLSYPTIISTGDQFFPSALRPPGFEKIFATFSYSGLIIDEVQAYDPRAVAIVVKFIQDITRMGGKFLLMTATLPNFIKTELELLLVKDYQTKNIYDDNKEKLKTFAKHKIKLVLIKNKIKEDKKPVFELPNPNISNIVQQAKKGKRVLVVLNTVRQAQYIYDKLIQLDDPVLKDKIWLLHSRFTYKDRRSKEIDLIEKEFKNPKPTDEIEGKILVATQVVEASLDIDVDTLFTELAPMDSLVQRMGRVLRRVYLDYDGNKRDKSKKDKNNEDLNVNDKCPSADEEENVIIWVFQNGLESGEGRWVYKKELLIKTLKILTINEEDFEQTNDKIKKIFEKLDSNKDKKQEKTEIKVEEVSSTIKENENIIEIERTEKYFSEYYKYELVNFLYSNLDGEGSYLKLFRQTLDILEAGYMSDRSEDARKMFRDIPTIQVIPVATKNEESDELKKNLKNEIEYFFSKNKGKDNLYTLFKKEILSKYVVNIPPIWGKLLPNVSEWVNNELFSEDYKLKEKIARWMDDIYFVNYAYNSQIGITQKGLSPEVTDSFLFV